MYSNKLFIVCPFSNLENFIIQKYGEEVFFFTTLATILDNETVDRLSLRHLIERENIKEIIIAVDTSCYFINGCLKKTLKRKKYPEIVLSKIRLDNINLINKMQTLSNKQILLADLIVKSQILEILKPNNVLIEKMIHQLTISGMITNKSTNKIIHIISNYPPKNN